MRLLRWQKSSCRSWRSGAGRSERTDDLRAAPRMDRSEELRNGCNVKKRNGLRKRGTHASQPLLTPGPRGPPARQQQQTTLCTPLDSLLNTRSRHTVLTPATQIPRQTPAKLRSSHTACAGCSALGQCAWNAPRAQTMTAHAQQLLCCTTQLAGVCGDGRLATAASSAATTRGHCEPLHARLAAPAALLLLPMQHPGAEDCAPSCTALQKALGRGMRRSTQALDERRRKEAALS